MKKIFLALSLLILVSTAIAQDLTYSVINTAAGMNTGSVDLSVSGGVGPYTYSWTGPSGFISNTEDLSGLAYGNYTVLVTDKYCGTAVITVFVDNELASTIDEIEGNPIGVFPNPANGKVSITSGKVLNDATFRLINVTGQTVMQKGGISGNLFLFDVSEQAKGIYFIEINHAGTVSRTRFIKGLND